MKILSLPWKRILPVILMALTACDPPRASHAAHGGAMSHATQHGQAALGGEPAVASSFVREMNVGMAKMMDDMHAPGYSGDTDVDFLAMMIPHHEGAVEMARLQLIHGRDPLTRRLAEDIIASQTAEIQAMRQRLAILRQGRDARPDDFPALDGTRGTDKPPLFDPQSTQ